MKSVVIIFLSMFFMLGLNEGAVRSAYGQSLDVRGAWQTSYGQSQSVMICSDKYFSVATYDLQNKNFIESYGGSYRVEGNSNYVAVIEFHSSNPEAVGQEITGQLGRKKGVLTVTTDSQGVAWTQLDDGTPGKLPGAWVITGRMRQGQMSTMTPGARRTMKILSGTRFQWIAYNVETKEFSGTGGGNYTTENGKYTENIQFFSRDSSRVGQSLTFDFSIEDGHWRHKGVSSKGEPIDEVWTKREKIGL